MADNLLPQVREETCPSVATGDRIFRERPEVYRKICEALAAGESVRGIKRMYKVAHTTIAVISRRERGLIEASREHLKGLTGHCAKMALERLIEKLDKDEIPPAALPFCAGLMVDKARAADGDPVTVTETRKVVGLEEVRRHLKSLKSAVPVEVVEVESSEVEDA